MTKKDYELLAAALLRSKPEQTADVTARELLARQHGHNRAVWAVSEALASDNPAFNKGKFLRACGALIGRLMP